MIISASSSSISNSRKASFYSYLRRVTLKTQRDIFILLSDPLRFFFLYSRMPFFNIIIFDGN